MLGIVSMRTWMNSILKSHKRKQTHMVMEMKLSMTLSAIIDHRYVYTWESVKTYCYCFYSKQEQQI